MPKLDECAEDNERRMNEEEQIATYLCVGRNLGTCGRDAFHIIAAEDGTTDRADVHTLLGRCLLKCWSSQESYLPLALLPRNTQSRLNEFHLMSFSMP